MERLTKRYMNLISVLGIVVGLSACWRVFSGGLPQGVGPSTVIALVALCVLCRCLPLYVREDCTIDMSFISVLAVALVMGPAGALVLLFLTTPLEIVPTESGKGFYHIFNTDPHKLLFNTSNLNLSLAVGGAVYYALGGTPGNISLPGILLPAIGYVISAVGTNALIISGVFYLESRMRFFSIFGHMLVGMIPSIVCSSTIGYFLAMLLKMERGHWLAFLFMLPLLLARFSFKLYLDSQKSQYEVIRALTAALEAKDTYTRGHSMRVAGYACLIAQEMHLPRTTIHRLLTAGLYHDIGKIGVPDSILQKPGRLTPEEREVIEHHPMAGVDILKNINGYQEILSMVGHHHEFYNGKGYPDGTCGEDLPVENYILGAADAYDAITSDRPYRKGRTPQQAAEILRKEAGEQFHPDVARVAAQLAEEGRLTQQAAEEAAQTGM